MLQLSEEEWQHFQTLGERILQELKNCVTSGVSPESDAGRELVKLHKEWLCKIWAAKL